MNFRFIFWILLSAGLISCATETLQKRAVASDPGVQSMAGFQMVATDEKFQKFTYQERGHFLISNAKFQTRAEAAAFCRSYPGFELSEWLFPGIMTMSTLPFDDLRANNRVEKSVLGGEQTLGGNPVSGTLFWIRGKTSHQEAQLSAHPDMVYEMLDGCGPGCEGIEQLSAINTRLRQAGQPVKNPQAICTDQRLQANLSK